MKYLVSSLALLMATVMLASAEETDLEEKRKNTIAHYANKTKPIMDRVPLMEKETGCRKRKIAANNSNTVYGLVEVAGMCNFTDGDGRRQLQTVTTQRQGTVPFPYDGTDIPLGTASTTFKEKIEDEVQCFFFNHTTSETEDIEMCGDVFEIDLSTEGEAHLTAGGFGLGDWEWYVIYADGSHGQETHTFTVSEVSTTPQGIVTRQSAATDVGEAEWTFGGQIQGAAGRIYFSSLGVDYACSGTAIKDNKSGRSLVFTAAHCVFDDIDWNWGSNVVFIPNRDAVTIGEGETGADIHRQCEEDICGCWTMSAGVVHDKWVDEDWPARLAWDYGFWIVDDVGAHEGNSCGSDALDEVVDEQEFAVGVDLEGLRLHGLGYSLEHNPDFRYCSGSTGFESPTTGTDTYWLDGCGLSGGASGGPWVMDMDTNTGIGKIVTVNSWSYSDDSGMGAPIIHESEARCLVNAARDADFEAIEALPDGEEGIFVNCYDRPCVPAERRLRGDGRVLCEVDVEEEEVEV